MVTPLEVNVMSAMADYEFRLKEVVVGFGAKVSLVETDNTFEFYKVEEEDVFNVDRSNDFEYSEQINAGFINLSGKFKKFNYQFGLRAEQTVSEGLLQYYNNQPDSLVDRNYLNWFPSGGVSTQLNPINSLSINFSRRITRPNYRDLNPFEQTLNELSFRKGNPFLQPQYTNNFKISHTYKYRYTTSLTYSYIEDFFAQIEDTLDTDKNFIITRNVADQQIINLGISLPIQIKDWWSVYLNANAFYATFTANDESFNPISQYTLNMFGLSTFVLPRGFNLEMSGWYNSPSIWGGTYNTSALGSIDLALQKTFYDNKLSVRVAVSDVFFTQPWEGNMEYGGLKINGNGGSDSRQFKMNISYNFGNQQMKSIRLREGGAKEEGNRI